MRRKPYPYDVVLCAYDNWIEDGGCFLNMYVPGVEKDEPSENCRYILELILLDEHRTGQSDL